MSRHRADWWQKRVDELARGGDADVVALRHGVRASTLRWWRTELKRRAGDLSRPATFLPVVVARALAPSGTVPGDVEVVVEMGAARVSLRGAVSAAHVEAIVRELASRC